MSTALRPDIDEVAVERAVHGGRPVSLNRDELMEAIRQLHHRGHSDSEVGRRVGLSGDAVFQLRRRHHIHEGN